MLIGHTLLAPSTDYSPWTELRAENATFVIDVIAVAADTKLKVTIQTKNADELDSAAVTATGGTMDDLDSVAVTDQRATAIKQLVRLKFEVSTLSEEDENFVHFRVLDIIEELNR